MKKMKKKRNDRHNLIYDVTILVEILAILACLLLMYMHLPAQQYRISLRLAERYLNEMNFGLAETYMAGGDHNRNSNPVASLSYYQKARDAWQELGKIGYEEETTAQWKDDVEHKIAEMSAVVYPTSTPSPTPTTSPIPSPTPTPSPTLSPASSPSPAQTKAALDYDTWMEVCFEDAVQRNTASDKSNVQENSWRKRFDFTGDGTDDILIGIKIGEADSAEYFYICDTGEPYYAYEFGLSHTSIYGYQHDIISQLRGPGSSWGCERYTWNGSDFTYVSGIGEADGAYNDFTSHDIANALGIDESQVVSLMNYEFTGFKNQLNEKAAAPQSATLGIVEYQQSSEKVSLDINGTDGILRLHNAMFAVTDSKYEALGKSLGELKDTLVGIAEKNQNAGYADYGSGSGYEETMRAEVVRNDGTVFSVRVTDQFSYTHMAEADPRYRGEWGFNYDAQTGKLLTLDDVFPDSSDLLETIVQENASAAGDDADALLDRMAATRTRLKDAPIWWLTDSGFVLNAEAEADINDEGKDDDAPDIDWYYSGNGAWTDGASISGSIDVGFQGVERLDLSLPYEKYRSLFQSVYLPRQDTAMLSGMDHASQEEQCLEDAISRSEETDQEHAKRRASVTKFDFTGDGTDDIVVAIKETYDYENKQAAYCYICDSGRAVYADEINLSDADDICGYQNDLIVRYEDASSAYSWYNQRFTWNGSEFVSTDTGISNADTEDIFIEDVPGIDISQLTDLYDLSVYA